MDKSKKGAVLVLTLLVMFVGGIILGGLFMYLDTSLLLATKGEENAVNYYAADSGIEDAIYGLLNGQNYSHKEYILEYTNSTANNRAVDIAVENNPSGCGDNCYLITSTATHNKSGAITSIESYVRTEPLDFYRFGEDAITTNCSALIRGQKTSIQGNVTYVCDVTCLGDPPATNFCPDEGENCCIETVNGTVRQDTELPPGIDWWPETWAMVEYFSDMAEDQDAVHIDGDYEIDMVNPANANLGPLYIEGNLLITSSSKNIEHTNLNGILYVAGDLSIKGEKEFIMNLNDQIIFVEGNGENTYDIYIDQQCNFEGSGAIITIGDIYFEPKLTTGSDDFIFIMSLEGSVLVQPSGDFYGSIAGQDVNVQPNLYIERTDSADFWNTLPDTDVTIIRILTYDIIDQ